MKYIEKNFEACEVVAYEEELAENQLDKESLADNSIHPSLQGPDVYDLVKSFSTFKDLKEWMFKEQGGICCYCGCRLEYPNHPQYVVEHVFPKDKNRMLAGEYENFLLSCRPTIEEEQGRMAAPKKEKKSFFHCDKAKESEILTITPLQEDCQQFFKYDEFGGVVGADEKAQKDVDTLNLNCKWLSKRREAAIDGEINDEDGNLLPDEELRQRLDSIMDLDKDGMHTEFCFVIKSVLQSLLSQKDAEGK